MVKIVLDVAHNISKNISVFQALHTSKYLKIKNKLLVRPSQIKLIEKYLYGNGSEQAFSLVKEN